MDVPPALGAPGLEDDFLSRVSAAEHRDRKGSPAKARRVASPARAQRASSPAKTRAVIRAPSPSATFAATNKKAPGVAASNKKAFVAAPKESFSVTNQPKLKYGNVEKDLQRFGFKVLGPIAAGAFSTIVRAKHKDWNEVAIKTFANCVGKQAEEHQRELEVLRLISQSDGHANIATLLTEYESPQGATHAVLVYCAGGTLNMQMAKLRKSKLAMRERDAAVVTAQVALALGYLHTLGVAHRDIKPANVLFDGKAWRLCDFGFAVVCGNEKLKEVWSMLTHSTCTGLESLADPTSVQFTDPSSVSARRRTLHPSSSHIKLIMASVSTCGHLAYFSTKCSSAACHSSPPRWRTSTCASRMGSRQRSRMAALRGSRGWGAVRRLSSPHCSRTSPRDALPPKRCSSTAG